jgi:centrosomal protein CEP164
MTTGVDSSSGDFLIAQGYEVLDEELDENYEPSQEEIKEYAKYLGMDLNKDSKFFYIAKEGLKAPLPGPWKPCKDPQNEVWYYNFDTKEMQREHPCDDYYRKYYLNARQTEVKKKEESELKK